MKRWWWEGWQQLDWLASSKIFFFKLKYIFLHIDRYIIYTRRSKWRKKRKKKKLEGISKWLLLLIHKHFRLSLTKDLPPSLSTLLVAGRAWTSSHYIFFYSRAQIQAKQTNLPINITNVRAKNNKKY